ncbi:extra-large guanine nucleotide-binding protein 1-like isoform X1 [Pyrus x bretschneideri]|uniref:extra-large guanine nucleotide-binding protein 1-like isoform X1 n=1 Tax=Pyrus x bretschneideri TaxID=225117 RepID=UPI0020308EBC|nr:extra-large guanine nucleotide-binding protein 1-like isoform X1 [Pyrus x bretschneideri]
MAYVMRKLSSAMAASGGGGGVDREDFSTELEFSFADEYKGPPVGYVIPNAVPVDIHHIPTAAPVSSGSLLNNSSLPVIQPIVKSNKKPKKESKLASEAKFGKEIVSSDSVTPAELEISKGEKGVPTLSDKVESSGDLGFSGNLSGSSKGVLELLDDGQEAQGFQNYMSPGDWGSSESGLSSRSLSSEVFSGREEADAVEIPHHVKRPSAVTFRDPDSNDIVQEEESDLSDGDEDVRVRPTVERNGKKGSCYRCGKGNKLTEKEVCIVCGAKYCYNCVLRAMGSMPEGRKCVSCISFEIDESRRRKLGKCSRMLKRLLTKSEVELIMKAEISCQANQLPGNLIFVNDEPLSQEELVRLQSCRNPPKKIKPGYYWYDKVSGFWGKEGHRPCQIISPHLNVRGHIRQNASNGDTNILINSREITKLEAFMLKLAGVPCEGNLHYWVSEDGSYQEEGMNKVKGKIWDKTTIKLVCNILSLPIPSDSANLSMEEVNTQNTFEEKMLNKIVLVGHYKSGTSTIFKQAKILYNVPFSEDERQSIKLMIQSRLYSYLGILLEGRELFEEESLFGKRKGKGQLLDEPGPSVNTGNTSQLDDKTKYSIGPRLKAFSDWLLKSMVSGNLEAIFPAATREYAPFVEDLWKDPAIQATYDRRNEIQTLPRPAAYFLDRAVEISRTDYEPSDMDILYAEGITSSNSLTSMEFLIPPSAGNSNLDPPYQHNPSLRYQLIRVHQSSLGGNCKLVEMFEDVNMVAFCVSLTDYDEFSTDVNGVSINKMMASKQLFENIVTHRAFDQKYFLLILNKFDLLEEKIDEVPLTRCEWFYDFNPVPSQNPSSSHNNSNNPTLAHRAFQYVAVKFKRLFHSLTDRKLFVSLVTALDSDTVDEALRYASEILKWEEEVPRLINEFSSASIEASSSA